MDNGGKSFATPQSPPILLTVSHRILPAASGIHAEAQPERRVTAIIARLRSELVESRMLMFSPKKAWKINQQVEASAPTHWESLISKYQTCIIGWMQSALAAQMQEHWA